MPPELEKAPPDLLAMTQRDPELSKLRRELSRLDTVLFLISAMVVVDTIGAIAIGGVQAFTWLVVLFVFFFVPSALISAELGAALPEEGGVYVWVRMAFGRLAGAMTSMLYWAGTPMWLGGSVAAVAITVYGRFLGDCPDPACSCSAPCSCCWQRLPPSCRFAGASGYPRAEPSGRSSCSGCSR